MRLSLFTRLVAAVIAPVLMLAAVLLYGFPFDTARLFAWPVKPPMTALVMGAGYAAGAAFFVQVLRARRWAEVAPTLWGVAVFAPLMLAATLLHRDRFTHDHPAYFLWLGVYLVTPFLVPWVILHNRRSEASIEEEVPPSGVWRALLGAIFLGLGALAICLFAAPATAAGFWPWTITPLTSRVLGAWAAAMSIGGLAMVGSGRRAAWPLTLTVIVLWLSLILLGVPRARESFASPESLRTFVVAVGAAWLVFVAAGVDLARRREK